MINQVEYYKVLPRICLRADIYGEIENFIHRAKEILESEGNVLLVLEPGDATHYEFMIIQCGDNLAVAAPQIGWSFLSGTVGITPGYIESKTGLKINPYTLGVVCQVLQDIYGGEEQYYDWEKCIPVGIRRPDDDGETEEDTEAKE